MLKKIAFFVLGGLLSAPLFGQVHKCPGPDGKVIYQEKPCSEGSGTVLEIEIGNRKEPEKTVQQTIEEKIQDAIRNEPPHEIRRATNDEENKCLEFIKAYRQYKDPESVRIEGWSYMSIYQDGSTKISLSVNAKNGFGGYTGAEPAICKYKPNGRLDDVIAF